MRAFVERALLYYSGRVNRSDAGTRATWSENSERHVFAVLGRGLICFALFVLAIPSAAQQDSAPATSGPSPATNPGPDSLQAADDILATMSNLLSLPILHPVKKSIRSREQIRQYLLAEEKKDRDEAKDYADQKTLEEFGLIPKGYPLEESLNDILTEQIVGMYDPDEQEFFISDRADANALPMVMAHELTHALQDQHYHIDAWRDAAKPNDDAETARDAVLEGAATAAMVDYVGRNVHKGARDIPDIDISSILGDVNKSPELSKAPLIIRDELVFPYAAGVIFVQHVLRATAGWNDFGQVFANPPASTQQIMHPDLYLRHVQPVPVTLPDFSTLLPPEWKKLDENLMGEFGVQEILKQFLGADHATEIAPAWAGDRYAIFENQKTKRILLVFLLALNSDAHATHFFGAYSEVLDLKDPTRTMPLRQPNFYSFDTPDGGVFLRCAASECLDVEGADRLVFDRITHAIGWTANPDVPQPAERQSDPAATTVPAH
jgi:hypothetical protein